MLQYASSEQTSARQIVDQSYLSGAADYPLLSLTIGDALRLAAQNHAGLEAVVSVHDNVRWTFAELDAKVDALASGLLAMGLKRGDRIGIWAQNSAAWVLLQFASARAGLILVTFNTAYRSSELAFVVNKVGCRAIVMAPGFKDVSYFDVIESIEAPSLEWRILTTGDKRNGYTCLESIMALADGDALARLHDVEGENQFDDVVNVQFTSGTTGQPKGVCLTHHNILNNGYFVGKRAGVVTGDRICIPVPLFHCFGMVMANLAAVTHGATMVYPSAAFEPATTLLAVEQERCTLLYGVPTMFIAELNHPDFAGFDLSSLRGGIMAGSPCPIEVMRQVMTQMHMRDVTIAYGMTETSPVSLQTRISDTVTQRVETVGTVSPHIEVKLVDDAGFIVPRGQQGELCTRGYSVMRGYWEDAEASGKVMDQAGWMHSGDLAVMDDQGFVRITGRIKDLIIRGGENIAPREIEELLYAHPDVIDVQVIGVPDQVFGEAVCAWIIARRDSELSEDCIRAFCQTRIAHYKIPKYFRFVDAFPSTASGKVQKFLMRQIMTLELTQSQ